MDSVGSTFRSASAIHAFVWSCTDPHFAQCNPWIGQIRTVYITYTVTLCNKATPEFCMLGRELEPCQQINRASFHTEQMRRERAGQCHNTNWEHSVSYSTVRHLCVQPTQIQHITVNCRCWPWWKANCCFTSPVCASHTMAVCQQPTYSIIQEHTTLCVCLCVTLSTPPVTT